MSNYPASVSQQYSLTYSKPVGHLIKPLRLSNLQKQEVGKLSVMKLKVAFANIGIGKNFNLRMRAFPLKQKLYLESISNKTKFILKRAFPIKQKCCSDRLLAKKTQSTFILDNVSNYKMNYGFNGNMF